MQRHVILLAIQGAFETHLVPAGSLSIRIQPSPQSVQACLKIKAKQLKLVPVSYAVKKGQDVTGFQCVSREGKDKLFFTAARPRKGKAVVPAFFVTRCVNAEDADMEVTTFRTLVSAGSNTHQHEVYVPMLQNTVDLEEGDELLLAPLEPADDPSPKVPKRNLGILVDRDNASLKKQKRTE